MDISNALNKPSRDSLDWHIPLNENFEKLKAAAAAVTSNSGNITVNADYISVSSLESSDSIGNATYASESDVPSDLTEGSQVWIESEDRLLIEDGT